VSCFLFPPFLCSSKEKGVPPRTGATLINQMQIADASEKTKTPPKSKCQRKQQKPTFTP
jgi:hypothetical protein